MAAYAPVARHENRTFHPIMKKIIIAAAASLAAICAQAQVNSPAPDGYCRRGVLMYQNSNYVGCIDQMSRVKEESPTAEERMEADFYIAMSSAHLGKTDAHALLSYFLWRHPDSPHATQARMAIANLMLDAREYGDAYTEYSKIDPATLDSATAAELAYNSGFCLLKRGEYDRARTHFSPLTSNKKYGNGARFYLGYIAYAKKDYAEAKKLLSGLSTSKAPADMADYYLAQIYYIDGDYANAAAKADAVLSRNVAEPQFRAEALRIAGESAYQLDDYAKAVKLLRQYADATDSPLPSAMYLLGVADYREGDYDDAISRLTPVAELNDAMGQSANLYIGQAFMQQGNYSSAMIAFDRALNMDFDTKVQETAFYNYAVAGTQGGKIPFGSSVTTFEEFLRRYPNSKFAPQIGEYLVVGYMTDDNYPAALASIEAVKKPSKEIIKAKQQVLYTLGARELASNDIKSAIAHLTQAEALASNNPQIGAETSLWLGEALYADGQYEKAAKKFEAYLANRNADRDNRPLANYDLAYTNFSLGNYAKALNGFQQFVNAPGKSDNLMVADAYNRLGDCHYYKKDFPKATNAYNKAYTISPSTGDYALFQEAIMKGYQRDHKGKISGMKSMMQKFPTSSLIPTALIEVGESYEQLGSTDAAVEAYSQASARYPATKQGRQASLLLAMVYINNDNTPQAISTYKELITSAPTSDEARQASDNLKSLMAEQNRIEEYADFIAQVPSAQQMKPTELDNLTYDAAVRDYLNTGKTGRIVDYLAKFPNGIYRPEALSYLIEANTTSGDRKAVIKYSNELIANYPDNTLVPDAYKALGDTYMAMGNPTEALNAYTRLEQAADPYMTNDARLGIIRAADALKQYDTVIAMADALCSSSTVGPDQRSEARYMKGIALNASGQANEAADIWADLAKDIKDEFGTRAAYSLAEQQYAAGNLKKAHKLAEDFISSDTPYDYWYARGVILFSDINRAEGNSYEADFYLKNLKENYPGSEADIFEMIDDRVK